MLPFRLTFRQWFFILAVAALFCGASPAAAQKRRAKAAAKAPVQREDMSRWRETPVCRILVADSAVVPQGEMWSHIPLPSHLGHIVRDKDSGTLYHENDFGDQRFFAAADTSGRSAIYRRTLLAGEWGGAEAVSIGGECYDYQCPFPMPDGQTLIFAARNDGDDAGRSLSLYTTTYDADHDAYLTPQRLPYPFNSDADDLYYIEDEADTLAWLVTTRRQPQGQVCIYTARAQQPWEQYDPDTTAAARLRSLAMIERIADTWKSAAQRQKVLSAVAALKAADTGRQRADAMRFVVDDNTVVTSPDAFTNAASRKLYLQYCETQELAAATAREIDEYRQLYHRTTEAARPPLAETITSLVSQERQARRDAASLAKQIRRAERGAQ